jgi:acyl-CoA synthetase (AMP-forming)/AMP-acid ligase II
LHIVSAFLAQARHQPAEPAICAPGTAFNVVSYGRLEAMANNISRHALDAGLRSGDTVAVLTGDPIFQLALFLGLARIGVLTLSNRDASFPRELTVDAIVTDNPSAVASKIRTIRADLSWTSGDGRAPADDIVLDFDAGHEAARIALTSGTTGKPKAVALTHDNLIRRLQAYDVVFGNQYPACSRTFIDLTLATSFGFALTMHVLSRGGTVFCRGNDAAETLQAFGLYNVQCMIAAPSGVAEFLDYYEQSPELACPFKVMLASGSFLSRTLSERVRARMCANLFGTYAATELSPAAAAPARQIADIDGAVGYVMPWVRAQAVDQADRPLKWGEEGVIRLRGHTCVSGYVGNPPASERIFRDGWFYPGDIGRITEDRLLIITGREKAVINLGGDKVSPEKIEAAIAAFPGIKDAAVFGRPNDLGVEEIWAAVVAEGELNLTALGTHCARELPAEFVPAHVVRVAAIPRNAMGRIDRRQVSSLALKDRA